MSVSQLFVGTLVNKEKSLLFAIEGKRGLIAKHQVFSCSDLSQLAVVTYCTLTGSEFCFMLNSISPYFDISLVILQVKCKTHKKQGTYAWLSLVSVSASTLSS